MRNSHVIKSLGKIGPAARSAVPAILEVLGEAPPPKTEVRRSSSDTATETGPPHFAYEEAIVALGRIGDDSDQVLSRLRQEFSNDDGWQSRLIAMQSLILLCRHADHSEILLPDLIRALEDENSDVRLVAACLGQIWGDRTPAISSLIKALDNDDPWVVSAAALSLREIGPPAKSAAPRLRELTENGRNRSFNAIRVQRGLELRLLDGEQLVVLRFPTGAFDLGRLSVSQAARLALEVIDSTVLPADTDK
jgi:HEAT repeat protein